MCCFLTVDLHFASFICHFYFRNGTSMISLIIPPKDQISRVAKMLADEFGTASNIKSRVNRLSVLGAITSVQQRLKLYNKGQYFSQDKIFFMGSTDFCLFLWQIYHFWGWIKLISKGYMRSCVWGEGLKHVIVCVGEGLKPYLRGKVWDAHLSHVNPMVFRQIKYINCQHNYFNGDFKI